jgi:hypothetical protein
VRWSLLGIPWGITADSDLNDAFIEDHSRAERLALVLHRSAVLILFFQSAGAGCCHLAGGEQSGR